MKSFGFHVLANSDSEKDQRVKLKSPGRSDCLYDI